MVAKNKIFNKFSEEVCSQIKCSEVHSDIEAEIDSHLEEIKEEYMTQGVTEQEAERQAVSHMGDSEKIGFDLNKIYEKRPEYKTLIITLIFMVIGSFIQITIKQSSPLNIWYYNSANTIIFSFIGIIVGTAIYILDYRKLEKYSMKLFIIVSVFAIFSLLIARPINGILYLNIFGRAYDVGFGELVLYIISLCGILPKMYTVSYKYIKIISMYTLCSFFIFISGNFTYLVMFYFIITFLLIYLKFSKKFIGIFLAIPSILSLYYFMILEPYRFARFTGFIHFKELRNTSGYSNYRIYELLVSSKFLGNGVSKEIIINAPSLNRELIYCYIIYTFGWIAGAVIFALIIVLLVNLFKTSKFIKNSYGNMLFLSISLLFTIEFLLSVLLNLNLLPTISVSMPFLSYSDTTIIINLALVGVICSIYGRKNLSKSLTFVSESLL